VVVPSELFANVDLFSLQYKWHPSGFATPNWNITIFPIILHCENWVMCMTVWLIAVEMCALGEEKWPSLRLLKSCLPVLMFQLFRPGLCVHLEKNTVFLFFKVVITDNLSWQRYTFVARLLLFNLVINNVDLSVLFKSMRPATLPAENLARKSAVGWR